MESTMVVCKRSKCEQVFRSQALTGGRPRKFCSDYCRATDYRKMRYQPKQIRPLGPCKKCGNQIVGRFAMRRYCDSCLATEGHHKRPAEIPGIRTCTNCSSDFYAVSRSGPLPKRCSFCMQTKRAWMLRYCTWCGDLFGATARHRRYCSSPCLEKWKASGATYIKSRHRQETKTCAYCRTEFETSMSTKTHCSRQCVSKGRPWKPEGMKAKGARSGYAKARREAQRAGDKDLTTYTIWKAEGGHCRLCNKATIDPTTPRALKPVKRDAWASLDHIKPISAGGTHTWDNAQLLCYPCNSGKVHTDRDLWGGAVKILESVRARRWVL